MPRRLRMARGTWFNGSDSYVCIRAVYTGSIAPRKAVQSDIQSKRSEPRVTDGISRIESENAT